MRAWTQSRTVPGESRLPQGRRPSPTSRSAVALLALLLGLTAALPTVAADSYWCNGQRVWLTPSNKYVAVQTASQAGAAAVAQSPVVRSATVDQSQSRYVAQQGVLVLATAQASTRAVGAVAAELATQPGVLRVLRTFGQDDFVQVVTDQFLVRFQGVPAAADRMELENKYNVTVIGQVGAWLPDTWIGRVNAPDQQDTLEVTNAIAAGESVVYCSPNFLTKLVPMGRAPKLVKPFLLPNDPLFPNQWHLNSTGQLGAQVDADVNAVEAWDITTGDPNLIVGVVDLGTDIDHEDLVAAGKQLPGYDFLDDDFDVRPNTFDEAHGTSVTGVIVATHNNGIGVSGGAPGCRFVPVRLLAAGGSMLTDAQQANSIAYCVQAGAALINNSWGVNVPPGFSYPLPDLMRNAIDFAVTQGRNGLGTLVLFAAGNGAQTCDNVGYTNYSRTFTVAACNDQQVRSAYSNYGTSVDVTAPSDDYPPLFGGTGINGITTTDITGAWGYDPGNYTNSFGGTSSATPLTSAVAALVMSADPALTHDEVTQLLRDTARKIDPAGGEYDPSGHSVYYGYGRVDAEEAVATAAGQLGTAVTIAVETQNTAVGGRATDQDAPLSIVYTLRNRERQGEVWDGTPVVIHADPGTAITLPVELVSGSQRWISPGTATEISIPVSDQPSTATVPYYHQLRRSFSVAVQSGAAELADGNVVTATLSDRGQPASIDLVGTGQLLFADTGSTVTFGTTSALSNDQERWVAQDQTPQPDGLPDVITKTVSLTEPEVIAQFFHQVRPRIVLTGTSANSTVATSKRKLFGNQRVTSGLSGTYLEFCDVRSQLAFSQQSTGTPLLAAEGVREFTVEKGLSASVRYVVQPQQSTSTVAVSTSQVPANGRTPVTVTVTIRDSAGNAVEGVSPDRVDVYADPTDGIQMTNPAQATDTTGRLAFEVTRDLPGDVTFTAALDGITIDSQATTQFRQVMRIPVPLAGIYLMTFPLIPDDAAQAIVDFDVTPKPTRLARLVDGTRQYRLFDAQHPDPLFNLAPGKGYFLKTNTAGTIEMTGEWPAQDSYDFPFDVRGFHQVGNPQANDTMLWSLGDFEVFQAGFSRGLLTNETLWNTVDPIVWVWNGQSYEMIADPTMPGTDGLRTHVKVFEGFFWRTLDDQLSVTYTPHSGRSREAEPISPRNFGISLVSTAADQSSTLILGTQRTAVRAAAPPNSEDATAVSLEVLTPDGGRAAADWLGQPITRATDWQVISRAPVGSDVTLSWPHLSRQLPRGYRARLSDPTTGRNLLLNTHSSYRYTSDSATGERQFTVTVLPPSSERLSILDFRSAGGRSPGVAFDVQLTSEATVTIRVTGLTGRLVAQTAPMTVAGNVRVVWDGLDQDGRKVPKGTYLCTLLAENEQGEVARTVRTVTLR